MLLWWAMRASWLLLLGFGALIIGGWMKVVLIICLLITSLFGALMLAEEYFEPVEK